MAHKGEVKAIVTTVIVSSNSLVVYINNVFRAINFTWLSFKDLVSVET